MKKLLFENQLQARYDHDNEFFSDSLMSLANAVMGERLTQALDDLETSKTAFDAILKYFRFKSKNLEIPEKIQSKEEQLDYYMQPYGISHRRVHLDHGWYHHAIGPMLGTLKEDGSVVALIPNKTIGYSYVDIRSGKKVFLNKKTEKTIDEEALCFYRPLPHKSLNLKDLMLFMVRLLNGWDLVLYVGMMGVMTLLGLLSPMFTKWLFGDVFESGSYSVLLGLAGFMIAFTVSQALLQSVQGVINTRFTSKINLAVEAAVMSRMLSLPTTFFKDYSPGELSQRQGYLQNLCSMLFNIVFTTGLTSVFSLVYIGQIFVFAPALVVPSIVITLATVVLNILTTLYQMDISKKNMKTASKTSGLTYATLNGIQKIKLAGAEKRMFGRWAEQYAKEAKLTYNPPTFLKISGTITLGVSLIGTLILYSVAVRSHVAVADYYAFNTAYAMISGAFMSLTSIVSTIANIRPSYEMAKPILDAEPEYGEGKEIIDALSGRIELSHVSFAYSENMPNVIDDLTLKIRPGEFLAIVGSTGCGKSTLLRLLLGFESPQKGAVFYDNKDLSKLDLRSVRRHIGTVMQDGKAFQGDVYSNIVISAPHLTLKDAWEAAEMADLADDIRAMPMGMHTLISEGQGGISGGQKQRLMIARAIVSKPKILMFDEATSALDNVTQKKVSESIDKMKCTRIVIAHRLSTIRHADRIIYLEAGKIVEEGTYEDLIALNGRFADLVERQRLDVDIE